MTITYTTRPQRHPLAVAACLLGASALTLLVSLALSGCLGGQAIYTNRDHAVPTIAGNGRVSQTAVAGVVDTASTQSPDGRALVDACLAIQRRWNEYLRSTGLANTQGGWWNWWRLMQLASVPDRCIDYATYGQPMSGGVGGMGVGMGGVGNGGRTWSY